MSEAKSKLIASAYRLLKFHETYTTSESSLVHDISNLLSGELTETMGPVDRDPPHHAPSDTIKVDHPDQYFIPPQLKQSIQDCTDRLSKHLDKIDSERKVVMYGDEGLTKRERFAMEIFVRKNMPVVDALAYADALIAELAKERK